MGFFRPSTSSGAGSIGGPSITTSSASSFTKSDFTAIAGSISSAIDTYYAGRVAQSQQKIFSQRRAFNFRSNQIGLKSSFLQQQHQLTMQQFELQAATFQLAAASIQYDVEKARHEFEASMSELNARQSERDAQATLLQGERQIGRLTLSAGQAKSSNRASAAARGVVLGEGSVGEVEASIDLVKEIDVLAIETNAVRESGNRRLEGVASQNQASFSRQSANASLLSSQFAQQSAAIPATLAGIAGQSAEQSRSFAANISTTDVPSFITDSPSINPGRQALTSFITQVTPVAAEWYRRKETLKGIANATAGFR